MDCTDGYTVILYETSPFYPGDMTGPSYVVSGIRFTDDGGVLGLTGADEVSGIDVTLRVGESVTHEGVGTFTLVDVAPGSADSGYAGGGGSAEFCFIPSEDFQVRDDLSS